MDSIQEGKLTSELLDNPLLQASLKAIESALIEQWQNTATSEIREEIWYTLKGLNRFEMLLIVAVQNGIIDLKKKEKYNG